MAYIKLFVGNEAKISIKNNQLTLIGDGKSANFPLEDIDVIMFENNKSIISTYTISELAKNGIVSFFCDEKHIPCAYLLPFNTYFNQQKVYGWQIAISAPLRKQLWKQIVCHKIENQNLCLKLCAKDTILDKFAKAVKSDDATNIEAIAANKYFKMLFGRKFSRCQTNSINSALNYGYAIVRGVVARSVVCHGLVPFLGIKHSNMLNSFNLVDDLIEVFRPYVDLCVFENLDREFNKEYKLILYNLLNVDCNINSSKYTLAYSVDLFVQSFVDSIEKQKDCLKFPRIERLSFHEYR